MIETAITGDGRVSAALLRPESGRRRGLVACIHGGGCNSGYFRLGAFSVADALLARGLSVLLVNRPGFAGNAPADARCSIDGSLPAIRDFLTRTTEEVGEGPLGLIGHSIGGAVALMLAADPGVLPIRAVAVSGIGDEAPPAVLAWDPTPPPPGAGPRAETAAILLGEEGSYSWQALTQLRRVAEPWITAEKTEIVHQWPDRWPRVAARIRVPVHLRLADGERVWCTGETVLARMAARLSRATMVDAALLPEGGHAYEIHTRGPELAMTQAAFMDRHLA